MRRIATAVALALVVGASAAKAQQTGETPPPPLPDASRFSRGLFVEGTVGARFFLGKVSEVVSPGPTLSLRVGYDLSRWLAVQAHLDGTTTTAEQIPTHAEQGLQLYQYTGELRAQLQLRRVGLYLGGGAGVVQLSNNLLEAVGVKAHVAFVAVGTAGLDVHSLNRHFSVGLGAEYTWLGMLGDGQSHALAAVTYLRYTQ